jgi:hypothetical protein
MSEWLVWLFGLHKLHFGDEGVSLSWARPLPAWGWLLVVLAAAGLAVWSYSRLSGGRGSRWFLAGMRGLLLVVLAMVAAGPQLVRTNERVEKDWVLVLVDRSASMTIRDMAGTEGAAGKRESREEELTGIVRANWPMFAELARGRTVVWMGFDNGAYDLRQMESADGGVAGVDLGKPEGRRTSLGRAIEQAMRRASARPVSGVVVLSDGRSIDEPGRQVMRRLQAEKIPVVTIPLGSPEPVTDLAIERVDSPGLAFLRDTVAVNVQVDRLGDGEKSRLGAPTYPGGKVQLVEKSTGLVLDEKPLPEQWENGRTNVSLTTHPQEAGKQVWEVRIVPGGADLIEENNRQELAIELVDRPLRVLYFDGYPRWEYRYIKNLLVRESSISSSAMLLAADRRYIQEGSVLLESMPRSPEEWAQFDVVVMGDVPGEIFTQEQLEGLRDLVALRGAGLLWIGGPANTPGSWRDTPLAELLPFAMGGGGGGEGGGGGGSIRAWDEPVTMRRTAIAERLGLLELSDDPASGWPEKLSDPRTGWSMLRFAQRIDPGALKPTAEVLATATPASEGVGSSEAGGGRGTQSPLVISMRYGAGRVLYVGTDEIWRWRYARGETLPERFWLPLIRLQGRESLARTGKAATLEATPRRAEVDQPVRIAVQLLDQSLVDAKPSSVTVRITREEKVGANPDTAWAPVELKLSPEDAAGMKGVGPGRSIRSLASTWVPAEAGNYKVEAVDPLLARLALAAQVEVALSDDELRHPETDHPLLARVSQETGGAVLSPDQVGTLPSILPKRELRLAGTPEIETLWDKPVVLVMLMLLLVVEWVGRKLIHLV